LTVLGEVNKQYVVTPDIDRLLGELFINKGKTFSEVEAVKKEKMARVKAESGLMVLDASDED
jgi:DNA-directed RNA polymerase III subunit RPC4